MIHLDVLYTSVKDVDCNVVKVKKQVGESFGEIGKKMLKEKTKLIYFAVDVEFSKWLNVVSSKVGVTREQMVKEAIDAWVNGDLLIA